MTATRSATTTGSPGGPIENEPTDKQEIIEHLLNRSLISEPEAKRIGNLSMGEIQTTYNRLVSPKSGREDGDIGYYDDGSFSPEDDDAEGDDDPQCGSCGVYRSEHTLCGCSDGFITADAWRAEREAIRDRAFRAADDHLDDYGDYGCDY